jgi:D-mannonate dehydratase
MIGFSKYHILQAGEGTVAPVSSDELWQRVEFFLKEVLPVAEENGVRLAAHPDDPPAPALRRAARLVNQPLVPTWCPRFVAPGGATGLYSP